MSQSDNTKAEREAFERNNIGYALPYQKNEHGLYISKRTRMAFAVWQAARAQLPAPAPVGEVEEELPVIQGDDEVLIRQCPECGSGDVGWCHISVRPYCKECSYWGPINHGSQGQAVARHNATLSPTPPTAPREGEGVEAFEAVATAKGFVMLAGIDYRYQDTHTQAAWWGYQQGAALSQSPAAAACTCKGGGVGWKPCAICQKRIDGITPEQQAKNWASYSQSPTRVEDKCSGCKEAKWQRIFDENKVTVEEADQMLEYLKFKRKLSSKPPAPTAKPDAGEG